MNDAGEGEPAVAGNVTPPVANLVPDTDKATLPGELDTATFPKFKSTVFVIVMGITTLADTVADADACENAVELYSRNRISGRIEVKTYFMVKRIGVHNDTL